MLHLNLPQKVFLGLTTVLFLILVGWFLLKNYPASEIEILSGSEEPIGAPPPFAKSESTEGNPAKEPASRLTVYVGGSVKNEGVVFLKPGSRLVDAILAAGGLIGDADISGLNLAEKVEDGQKVNISTGKLLWAKNEKNTISLPVNLLSAEDHPVKDKVLININTATSAELEKIKGIGPKMAEKIVAYRKDHGRFAKLSDLLNVKGIGEAKLKAMQPFLKIS